MNIFIFIYSTYILCTIKLYIHLIYFVYIVHCIFNLYMLLYNHQQNTETEENNMDEFLKIIYRNYAAENEMYNDELFESEFKTTLNALNTYLGKDLAEDTYMKLIDDSGEVKETYFVMGMKLAIDIMNKEYIPKL